MTTTKNSIRLNLARFYDHPVASVSLELFFSVFAIIFLSFLAIKPTLLTISGLIKEIDDKEALNQQLSQKVAALSTVQTEYQAAEGRFAVLDEALPPSPSLGEILAILEKLASEQNITMTSLTVKNIPLEEKVSDPLHQVRKNLLVNVTVSGEFAAIRQYVESIRSVRRLLVVDSITFSLAEEAGKKQLQAQLNINSQYFAPATGKDNTTVAQQ